MSETLSGTTAPAPSPYRWAWYVPGLIAVGWGVYGLLTARMGPTPWSWGVFTVLGIAAHDALVAPIAVVTGWLLVRALPPTLRAPAQVGLIGTAVAVLAGLPYILGRGVSGDVPSALPFNYAGRISVLVAVLWLVMIGWAATRWAAGARAPVQRPDDQPE